MRRGLDIDAMRQAASHLIGLHDFRNLSKLDVANVSNFVREIYSAEIRPFQPDLTSEKSVFMLEIKGIAFLWHMVRCIMAVLFLVGERKETPDIILELLDVARTPAKPQYEMASEGPLVLHECGFESLSIHFQPSVLLSLIQHFEAEWERHMISAAKTLNSLDFIRLCNVRRKDVVKLLNDLQVKESSLRSFATTSEEVHSDGQMPWGAVMAELSELGVSLDESPKSAYVPLMKVIIYTVFRDLTCGNSGSVETRMRQGKAISPAANGSVWSGTWR